MALYLIRHDLIVLMIYLCAWVCATTCMHVLGLTHVVQQQQQQSAPDWIKVLLGCGYAPFVKSGFGFEIEVQGEVLCHPQEWYSSKRVREEQDWGRDCLLSRCVISRHADMVISRKTYLSLSLSHQPRLHFHHLCLESNAMSVCDFFPAGQHMPGQKVRLQSRPPFLLSTNLKLQERWRGSSPPISTNQVTFNNKPLHKLCTDMCNQSLLDALHHMWVTGPKILT